MTPAKNVKRTARRPVAAKLAALVISVSQLGAAQAACSSHALPGANVAGGEFNAGNASARYGYDYIYPTQTEVDLLKSLHLKLMRVPFAWERVQTVASGPLNEGEMVRLDGVVRLAAANGLTVVLDVHDYGAYHGVSLGSAESQPYALPDLWRRLASRYANQSNVVFGMMNEPNDMPADVWARIAQQTLAAIRAAGARNLVMIPGTIWDGAQSWFSPAGSLSNAAALLPLARGDDKVVFEVHQYFDGNFSGTSETCTGAASALSALSAIGAWARTNHVRMFLGESGVSQRPECVTALDNALATLERDKDVWYGWTYWAAGAWWGTYAFNLQSASGQAAQGAVLKARATKLNNASCSAPTAPPHATPKDPRHGPSPST